MNLTGTQQTFPEAQTAQEGSWWAVGALGVGAFAIVTTEFLPVGLLPAIATSLHQTEGSTGLMITVPGVLAAVSALAATVLAGKRDRRSVLVGLVALLALSNAIVALASDFSVVLIGRVLLGIVVGGFWTLGGPLGARMRPQNKAKAGAVILAGVSLGTVAGVPAGALLGELVGWRWAFGLSSAISLLVMLLLVLVLPRMPTRESRGFDDIRRVARLPEVRLCIAAVMVMYVGQFAAYTFISPYLLQVTRIAPLALGGVLLAFGVAAFFGNIVGGWIARFGARIGFLCTTVILSTALLLLALLGDSVGWAVSLSMLWGMGFGMLPIVTQTWLFSSAPKQLEAVQALVVSLSQVAIGAGSMVGGFLVDGWGITSSLLAAAGASLATLLLMGVGTRRARRSRHREPGAA
ncbi:MFS transporter [Comamonadaceae bacterium PP-2]